MSEAITIKSGYEKITCIPCNGTGLMPMGQGYYTWKSDRRRKPRCAECGGYGFKVVRMANPSDNSLTDPSTKGGERG